jgi:hypothetical protein
MGDFRFSWRELPENSPLVAETEKVRPHPGNGDTTAEGGK